MAKAAANTTQSGLFVTSNGGITPASFFLLIGAPLLISGRFVWGSVAVFVGLLSALQASMEDIKESDKQEIRCNILDPEDLVAELEALEESEGDDEKRRAQFIGSLAALAKKFNEKDHANNLALLCQQSAYLTLRLYPEDDEVIEGAIALLALTAKDKQVRQRNKYQADVYGLDRPIQVLRKALERAKQEEDEEKEEQMAEIQRKGCLYLGSISDGDKDLELAIKVVEEDGLEVILDAANWLRFHVDVANWALWAVFILCYENVHNKVQLVRLAGITTVCQLLKNNPNSLEVNRHGVAILFDLLREGNKTEGVKFDPWEVRRLALTAGLHNVILNAMTEFADSMDIMTMGQELLIGTGFQGDIPKFQQL
jgi:hypothetical protein